MATRLDEGLEDFFSRRVMDESSRCGSSTHSHCHQAPRPWKAPRVCPAPMEASSDRAQSQSLWGVSPTFSPFPTSCHLPCSLRKDGATKWNGGEGRAGRGSRPWVGMTLRVKSLEAMFSVTGSTEGTGSLGETERRESKRSTWGKELIC